MTTLCYQAGKRHNYLLYVSAKSSISKLLVARVIYRFQLIFVYFDQIQKTVAKVYTCTEYFFALKPERDTSITINNNDDNRKKKSA
jgi:hypothetical protein